MLKPILGAVLLAATTSLYAQNTPPATDAGKGHPRRYDCSQEKDPKACEQLRKERREKGRAMREQARKACEGQQGNAHRECMVKQGCAQTKDPAACEARVKERMEKHKQHREQRDSKKAPAPK
jgi:Spy/CpxP family protein refolding chaperone